ncbi:MAG: hypothetical protein ABSA16_00785 [Thermoguttaceae bacterium]|jgi:hypothetical protein
MFLDVRWLGGFAAGDANLPSDLSSWFASEPQDTLPDQALRCPAARLCIGKNDRKMLLRRLGGTFQFADSLADVLQHLGSVIGLLLQYLYFLSFGHSSVISDSGGLCVHRSALPAGQAGGIKHVSPTTSASTASSTSAKSAKPGAAIHKSSGTIAAAEARDSSRHWSHSHWTSSIS